MEPESEVGKKDRKRRPIAIVISWIVLVVLAVIYAIANSRFSAIVIWPFWVWMGVGLPLALGSLRRHSKSLVAATAFAWLIAWLLVDDQPWALGRSIAPVDANRSDAVRIVSLNCAGGSKAAVKEVLSHPFEIAFLQESPSRIDIQEAIDELGLKGAALHWGIDGSIVVRGTLEPLPIPRGTHNFLLAKARVDRIAEPMYLVSLRLMPPVLRFDLVNPDAWNDYTRACESRKEELREILDYLTANHWDAPLVIAGDFNTPPHEGVVGMMRPDLTDAFAVAGRGWGATAVNDYPMVRIDQIWFNGPWNCLDARAIKSINSDHRMATAILIPK